MEIRIIALSMIALALTAAAGCTGTPSGTAPPTPSATATVAVTTPADGQSCTTDADCVPARCCHPTGCTVKTEAPSCTDIMCTMVCQGPLDCGAGSCGCINGKCSVVPASSGTVTTAKAASLTVEASPQRYSPMMSSTPGIRLIPHITGVSAAEATFEWNATFGTFLTWNAPDYIVHPIGNPVANDGGTVYWTFIEKPASTTDPVIVTVTARDMARGAVLASSTVTLTWDGDYAVYVREV